MFLDRRSPNYTSRHCESTNVDFVLCYTNSKASPIRKAFLGLLDWNIDDIKNPVHAPSTDDMLPPAALYKDVIGSGAVLID